MDISEPKLVKKIIIKVLVTSFYALFVLAFAWICGQLFFEDKTNDLLASAKTVFLPEKEYLSEKLTNLRVIYPDGPINLEPTLIDPVTRQRLNNIYEPLVKPDRDLKMRPALAVAWGLIDPYTWEFRLRPDVKFHDGSKFDVEDVVVSLERARTYSGSEIAGILTTIKDIEVFDDYTFRITTLEPDPLLLQRLSMVLIIPSENKDEENFAPVGTGSYRLYSWKPDEVLTLEKSVNYWGNQAQFEKVDMMVIPNKIERGNAFLSGQADLLAYLPYDAVPFVEEKGFAVAGIPSLEVQLLLFNMDSLFLNTVEARRAVSLAIDQNALVEAVGGFARPVNQFVSNGIFGFNPDIIDHEYDLEKAQILVEKAGLEGKTLKFHLSKGLDVLGEHVRTQLSKIGINVIVSYLEMDKLWESMVNGDADLYFFGFKADLGDATDFLHVAAHTEGSFNVANYSNEEVDRLIDLSLIEMDPSVRLEYLQEAMRIVVEDDVVGVPLFEYETLYTFTDALDMQPRIDGFIYFDELTVK